MRCIWCECEGVAYDVSVRCICGEVYNVCGVSVKGCIHDQCEMRGVYCVSEYIHGLCVKCEGGDCLHGVSAVGVYMSRWGFSWFAETCIRLVVSMKPMYCDVSSVWNTI